MDILDQSFLRAVLVKKLRQHPTHTIKIKEVKQYIKETIRELPFQSYPSAIGATGVGFDTPNNPPNNKIYPLD